jgi:hypothetical protein
MENTKHVDYKFFLKGTNRMLTYVTLPAGRVKVNDVISTFPGKRKSISFQVISVDHESGIVQVEALKQVKS